MPKLQELTTEIIQTWGMPAGITAKDLARRGIMSPGALDAPETIPTWDLPAEGAQELVVVAAKETSGVIIRVLFRT